MPIDVQLNEITPVMSRPNEAHAYCYETNTVDKDCNIWYTILFPKEIRIALPQGYHFAGKDICVGPAGKTCDPDHSTWKHNHNQSSVITVHGWPHFQVLEYTLYVQNNSNSSQTIIIDPMIRNGGKTMNIILPVAVVAVALFVLFGFGRLLTRRR